MPDEVKAIVIVARPSDCGPLDKSACRPQRAIAYVFSAFGPALSFMQSTRPEAVVVEFGVEAETLDFYDAAKALRVPVVFSVNSLKPTELEEFAIKPSAIVYAGQGLPRGVLATGGSRRTGATDMSEYPASTVIGDAGIPRAPIRQ